MYYNNFLSVKILKVRYFLNCYLMDVLLGSRLSFIWRSVWGVRWVIEKGSRWLVGNGEKVRVWKDRWIFREIIFKLYILKLGSDSDLKVCELIDWERGCWRSDKFEETFLEGDKEVIERISVCQFSYNDVLVWYYDKNREFSIRFVYYVIRRSMTVTVTVILFKGSCKNWSFIWSLNILLRVKMFCWNMCRGMLSICKKIMKKSFYTGMFC